jgi:2-oxoglutarate ferredoxin oxidoreductase subunit beta
MAFDKMTQYVAKAHEWGERIAIGVLLDNRTLSTFQQRVATRIPSYRQVPPALRAIADAQGRPTTDLSAMFSELAVT